MALPDPCDYCGGTGGYWVYGGKRCDCPRGAALSELDRLRSLPPAPDVEPQISEETAAAGVSMLSVMKYFPSEAGARLMIADELRSMCADDEQMIWLVKRCSSLFTDWPGLPMLRRVLWSKFIPLDRMPAELPIGKDDPFPEGIPPQVPTRELDYKALERGDRNGPFRQIANSMSMDRRRDDGPIN